MPQQLDITLLPHEYDDAALLRAAVARQLGCEVSSLASVQVLRRSLDSRGRRVCWHATVAAYAPGETVPAADYDGHYCDCRQSPPVIIVGAGPAGLFATLRALQLGLRPVIVERGKPVEERHGDIVRLSRLRELNADSNWCFGEGGAGTYSDGKLYTRSTKRGDVGAVLRRFVEHGADPGILIDAHAHIGTDKLSGIIARMRQTVESYGGEYHFGSRVTDLIIQNNTVCGVQCHDGSRYEGVAVLLATGHSARDIYELFAQRGWLLEAKDFALGVRVEHPQRLINSIQYHLRSDTEYEEAMRHLPPAAYSLTAQVGRHGVFSFCMCPGGIIVPAATADGEQVVNGMSNALRNSDYANSGIAVTVSPADVPEYQRYGALALLRFQQEVERRTFSAAGGQFTAPMQRLTDFCQGRTSGSIGRSNYMGPTASCALHELLPPFVAESLRQGFVQFDRKMRGFLTDQAHVLAVESRTSSPVRIPRDSQSLQHPQLPGLYPCGEGAGYAGGIVSSALDGIRCMEQVKNEIR